MISSSSLRVAFVLFIFGILFALPHPACAQSLSAVFSGPQNMDQGLQNGLNNITGYVYFLPNRSQVS